MVETHEITRMLREWSNGKPEALDELMPVVYSELHRQANRFLRRERTGHTLQTTALIHEVYLRLIDQQQVTWQNRTHFFAIAAKLMRRILVDHARRRARVKRGGYAVVLPLEESAIAAGDGKDTDVIALDEALERLAVLDPRQARIVELRYFGGLTLEETAAALDLSRTTVADEWSLSRAWLHRELTR